MRSVPRTAIAVFATLLTAGCIDGGSEGTPPPAAPTPSPSSTPVPVIEYDCDECWIPVGQAQSLFGYEIAIDPNDNRRVAIAGRSYATTPDGEPTVAIDAVASVAISEDGGASWDIFAPPLGISADRYGMATGVAWDTKGRLHVTYAYDGTIVGGDIVVGTADPDAFYARTDDLGASWAAQQLLADGGDLPTVYAHNETLLVTWNMGRPLYAEFTDLERSLPAVEATVADCWFPVGGTFDGTAWIPCDGSSLAIERPSRWVSLSPTGASVLLSTACANAFATVTAFVAGDCDTPIFGYRDADGVNVTTILPGQNRVLAMDGDPQGRIHVIAMRSENLLDPTADDGEGQVDHVVFSPRGEELWRQVIDIPTAHYIREQAGSTQQGVIFPRGMEIEGERGYIFAGDAFANRSTVLAFTIIA